MSLLGKEIKAPILFQEDTTVPRWKLSYLASELYNFEENKDLYIRLWQALHKVGLHPLTPVDRTLISVEDWEELESIWLKMVQQERKERDILKRLKITK